MCVCVCVLMNIAIAVMKLLSTSFNVIMWPVTDNLNNKVSRYIVEFTCYKFFFRLSWLFI